MEHRLLGDALDLLARRFGITEMSIKIEKDVFFYTGKEDCYKFHNRNDMGDKTYPPANQNKMYRYEIYTPTLTVISHKIYNSDNEAQKQALNAINTCPELQSSDRRIKIIQI